MSARLSDFEDDYTLNDFNHTNAYSDFFVVSNITGQLFVMWCLHTYVKNTLLLFVQHHKRKLEKFDQWIIIFSFFFIVFIIRLHFLYTDFVIKQQHV